MARYRHALPQLAGGTFLTDSGLETTLIFKDGMDLPFFASIALMRTAGGRERLRGYFRQHAAIALRNGAGFVFESPTWRASPAWGRKLGISGAELVKLNKDSIALMATLRNELETPRSPMVLSANIGPRGDGYRPDTSMSASEAGAYHAEQIGWFRDTEADLVSAFTISTVEEALGIVRAAQNADMPCIISFTLETDGRLPTGQSLRQAIETVDAETNAAPAYYMINCAHPTHFEGSLAAGEPWVGRIRGVRANASRRSHAELDESTDLDAGDPDELGAQHRDLLRKLPHINVLGGCCGTDHRHVEAIGAACGVRDRMPSEAAA
jgi:homocysteine S-methyltransferase